jgi:uncharacterized protein with PIN domain
MIVIDNSALIAILFDEPKRPALEAVIAGHEACVMSALNAHETAGVGHGAPRGRLTRSSQSYRRGYG